MYKPTKSIYKSGEGIESSVCSIKACNGSYGGLKLFFKSAYELIMRSMCRTAIFISSVLFAGDVPSQGRAGILIT